MPLLHMNHLNLSPIHEPGLNFKTLIEKRGQLFQQFKFGSKNCDMIITYVSVMYFSSGFLSKYENCRPDSVPFLMPISGFGY